MVFVVEIHYSGIKGVVGVDHQEGIVLGLIILLRLQPSENCKFFSVFLGLKFQSQ